MIERKRFCGVFVLCALLAACGGGRGLAPVHERGAAGPSSATHYTVREGDTLYSISWRHGHDYKKVARWNGIEPPYLIYPGQRIRLTPPADTSVKRPRPADNDSRRARKPDNVTRKPDDSAQVLEWQWPTNGEVTRPFDADAPGKRGVAIAGELGAPIHSAASGHVVYTGSGLIGYGKLIIVKHNDTYLSAYGHNRTILVEEGEDVRRGQQIGEMGRNGREGPMLHFEIRRNGTPTDPLRYLPRR